MKIEISKSLRKLAKMFPCELYVVGGFVRNHIMEIEKEDVDICSKMLISDVEELLKGSEFSFKIKSKTLGSALICCGDENFEYTTFRRDFYGEGGAHMPQSVEFVDSVREDAKRRDFTCNAIYYDIKNDKFLDFYDGFGDIKRKIIR